MVLTEKLFFFPCGDRYTHREFNSFYYKEGPHYKAVLELWCHNLGYVKV